MDSNILYRFESKYLINEITNCWNWISAISNGYGKININGKMISAHRLSYEHYKGEIPKGFLVCHICNNTKCVNPDHLHLGTPQDNSNDMVNSNRQEKGEKHWNSKLTKLDVETIRYLYKNKDRFQINQRNLSCMFDISIRQIRRIIGNKNWK